MPAKPSEAPGIDKKRNTSVISKKSSGTESAQLSRVGSMHDPIKKQESTVSGVSQGSQGSGKLFCTGQYGIDIFLLNYIKQHTQ